MFKVETKWNVENTFAQESHTDAIVLEKAALQKQLITSAFSCLRVGGVLVYSTCTLNPVENEEVIEHLFEMFPGAVENLDFSSLPDIPSGMHTEKGYLRCWPHLVDAEGFFVARLRKTASIREQQERKKDPFESSEEETGLNHGVVSSGSKTIKRYDNSKKKNTYLGHRRTKTFGKPSLRETVYRAPSSWMNVPKQEEKKIRAHFEKLFGYIPADDAVLIRKSWQREPATGDLALQAAAAIFVRQGP